MRRSGGATLPQIQVKEPHLRARPAVARRDKETYDDADETLGSEDNRYLFDRFAEIVKQRWSGRTQQLAPAG
jgi:hypothetical protein